LFSRFVKGNFLMVNYSQSSEPSHLDILNQRLNIIKDMVRMVAAKKSNGFYLHGRGGTSKTYSVRQTLKEAGVAHCYVSGHITPMGLFDLLKVNSDSVIVIDDIGTLLDQPTGKGILLAALGEQSHGEGRVVTYRRRGKDEKVVFTGGIIMMSNIELDDDPVIGAFCSRANPYLYDPTDAEIIALMRHITADGWTAKDSDITAAECKEVVDFIESESVRLGMRPDMRTLCDKGLPFMQAWNDGTVTTHWRDMLRASMEKRVKALQFTLPPRVSKLEKRNQNLATLGRIVSENPEATTMQLFELWSKETGGARRTFFRLIDMLPGTGATSATSVSSAIGATSAIASDSMSMAI